MFACLAAILIVAADPPKQVQVLVTDADSNKPLENATIRIFNGVRPTPYAFTDAAGEATIDYPLSGDLTLDVHTTSHIQQRLSLLEMKPLPDRFEVKLRKGERTAGGLVVNEEGKPVANATVRFSAYLGQPEAPAPGVRELVCDIDAITDAQGRWRLRVLDASPRNLGVHVKHPAYAYIHFIQPPPGSHELLAGSAKSVLKRGVEVHGKVRDDQGKPIAGASVAAVYEERFLEDFSPIVHSSADGAFRLLLAPGRQMLTLQAPGHSPVYRLLASLEKPAEITVTMPPGRAIHGHVVDPTGQPIAGAHIDSSFQRMQTMSGLRLMTHSGADGSFELRDAPADAFRIVVSREGYLSGVEAVVSADRDDVALVLKPGKTPLPEALRRGGLVNAPTKALPKNAARPTGRELVGTVTRPDGGPAASALILRHTRKDGNGWFDDHRIVNEHFAFNRCTDALGRFTLPTPGEPYALAVSHESGWALWQPTSDRNLKEPPEIKLTPWATIKGTFILDGKPAGNVTLRYYMDVQYQQDDYRPPLRFEANAETDANGGFVMMRVPSKPGRLVRYMKLPNNGQTSVLIAAVSPKPGETLDFPATRQQGRTVVGRLKLPSALQREANYDLTFVCLPRDAEARSDRPLWPIPAELQNKPRREQVEWYRKWSGTPEAREYVRSHQRLRGTVESDGRFRFDGAKADTLMLDITLRAPTPDTHDRGDVLGVATKRFVVPPMPKGYDDQPLDLGEIDVVDPKAPRSGKKLPDFAAKELNGKSWKLSTGAGRVRLLDVWATWCGPCIESIPSLAALHEELAGKEFELVSMSVDDDPADAAALAKKEKCIWCQVHLGPKSPVLETLGVEAFPTFIVIDRNGVVVHRGNNADSAARAARAALAK